MITLIEALNYRCLRYIHQPLDRFHVLVGPNASGKTTFLEVISIIGRILTDGLDSAIREISQDPRDLLFAHAGGRVELAVEAAIPMERRHEIDEEFDRVRYDIRIGIDPESARAKIESEVLRFKSQEYVENGQRALFPSMPLPPATVFGKRGRGTKWIVSKSEKDNYYPETKRGKGGWVPTFQLGEQRSAFANLPEDETRFPVATWFKDFLTSGVQKLVLDSHLMRQASPPGQPRYFKTDGTNLPWVIEDLKQRDTSSFRDWIAHLRTALPDLVDIRTIEREDTRHRHLIIEYAGGLEVPSWMTSDGTLRLLALTLAAYLPSLEGVMLIEEPENGIHPKAIESMFQSLSNVYGAQVLLATHSPVILSIAEPEQVLCFAKDETGATDIVRGDQHPALVDWQRDTNLGVLFAAGVLG